MNKAGRIIKLGSIYFLIILIFQSCYTYKVASAHHDPSTEYKSKTVHSFLFGVFVKESNGIHVVAENCDQLNIDQLSDVKVKSNILFSLANVLTGGLYHPMKIAWRCGKPCNSGPAPIIN